MATTSNESDPPQNNGGNEGNHGNSKQNNMIECIICLDIVQDPVVGICGHLFCWPCLHQWFETQNDDKVCPICKSGLNKDKVIPIFGYGNSKEENPGKKIPPRPTGRRTEPAVPTGFPGFTFEDGQLSFGIGAFPFRFLTPFHFNDGLHENPVGGQLQDDQYITKLFLWIAVISIICLFLA